MPGDDDIIIICFGVGEVTCKNTVPLPHYENGITTSAVKFPPGTSDAVKQATKKEIEKYSRKIQQVIANVTGGDSYEFDEDVNALPECT